MTITLRTTTKTGCINKGAALTNSELDGNFTDLLDKINLDTLAAKTTPVDADEMGVSDSAASYVIKKITWASIRSFLFNSTTSKGTPVDADSVGLWDSAATTAATKLTWANLKAAIQFSAPSASKTTPVDADAIPLYDSAATTTATKLTWANLKTGINTALQGLALTWTAKHIFSSWMKVQQSLEKVTITAAAPSATQNFDVNTQAIEYLTSNAANNWTLNVRGDSGTTLDSKMAVGESLTISIWTTQSTAAYYQSALTIDGSAVTPKWTGGTAPTAGDISSLNIYTLTIVKTASATFTVIESKTKAA